MDISARTPFPISDDREYVIVNAGHRPALPGCLLFWGHLTEDAQRRSFGSYTHDFSSCERYSLDEIKAAYPSMPVFRKDIRKPELIWKRDNAAIRISDLPRLDSLGFRTMTVIMR